MSKMSFIGKSSELIETGGAPEIVGSGLGRIEFLDGGQACYVIYRKSISPFNSSPELQICGRVFLPLSAAPAAIDLTVRALIEAGLATAATFAGRFLM